MKKWFRVATADLTIDGRTITKEQLEKIAQNYDPRKYHAMINLEHFYYGGNYGKVLAVELREDDRGLGLFAELEPNEFLLNYNKQGQKLFTSIEILPNFPASGEYYLGGIAITDNPASQGVDMLEFSRNMPKHYQPSMEMYFGKFIESDISFGSENFDLSDDLSEAEAMSWLSKFKKFFNKKEEEMTKELEEKITKLSADNDALKKENEELKAGSLAKQEEKDKEFAKLSNELDSLKAEVEKLKQMPMGSQRGEAVGKVIQDNPEC